MEKLFLENAPFPDWGRIKENEAVYREIPIDAEGSGMSPGTTGTVYIDDPKIIRQY